MGASKSSLAFGRGKTILGKILVSVFRILIIVVTFSFFQVLIWESGLELKALALLSGAVSFGLFTYSLRDFTSEELGFTGGDWKRQIIYGILLGLGLFGLFEVYRFLLSPTEGPVLSLQFSSYAGIPIIIAIVISEEFFFRGYAITALERCINAPASCLISSILFVLYHQTALFRFLAGVQNSGIHPDYEHIAILFVGSILLSYLFLKKRSLIMPIAVHFVWNLLIYAGTQLESLPVFP